MAKVKRLPVGTRVTIRGYVDGRYSGYGGTPVFGFPAGSTGTIIDNDQASVRYERGCDWLYRIEMDAEAPSQCARDIVTRYWNVSPA